MMFKRILFPTDFSVYSNAVTACLPSLQSAGLKEVFLVHVIRSLDVPLPETYNLESYKLIKWSAEEHLNLLRMVMEGFGLKVFTRIEYGSPTKEILRIANQEKVDLIVIGAQGASLSKELMIGSTAFDIIRQANVPVLLQKAEVVREEGHNRCKWNCSEMFTRILHPTDFSSSANQAFLSIEKFLPAGIKDVTLLHVQDKRVMKKRNSEQLDEFDKVDGKRLEELSNQLQSIGLRSSWTIRHGDPAEETISVAEETKTGLIILGYQGRSAINELVTGSTVEKIVRYVKQPVLIIRNKNNERK